MQLNSRTTNTKYISSLFKKAGEIKTSPRLKAFLYGPTGIGKTIFALHMPSPCMIDLERGSEWYLSKFPDLEYLSTQSIDEVNDAVLEKIKEPGTTKTLIIDSFTRYFELIKDKHLMRLRKRKNNPNYDMQGQDWGPIITEIKSFTNKLLALDMNIIGIAQDKKQYSEEEFMKPIGTTSDTHKSIPFMFDTVLELKFGAKDERLAMSLKDRTNRLPERPTTFEFSYQNVIKYLDVEELNREPVKLRTDENLARLSGTKRKTKIQFQGKEMFTAGVMADTLSSLEAAITSSKLNTSEITDKLLIDYQINTGSLLDLREDEAKLLLRDLTSLNQQ